jgi:hypothetical protein
MWMRETLGGQRPEAYPAPRFGGLTPAQFLAQRFAADNCMSCGRGASGHTVTADSYGDPVIRCDADDEEDPLVVRAYHRRRLFGDLR